MPARKIKGEPAPKSVAPSKGPGKSGKGPAKAGNASADTDAPLLKLPKGDDFAFSPDGSRLWLAHTSVDASTVRGLDIPGGEQFAEFSSLPNLRRLACSPDAKRIAASNHYGIVALHDAATGKEIWKTPKTGDETRCLVYAPDGSMVLNSGGGSFVRRRDGMNGKELPPLDMGAGWLGGALAFSPDGKLLAVAAVKVPGEPYVIYWDWQTAKEWSRHRDRGLMSAVGFLPGGRSLLTAAHKQVNVWDVKSHARTGGFDLDHGLKGASVHPDRPWVAVNTYNGAEVRELPSGKLMHQVDVKEIRATGLAFSPDGRHVLLVASPRSLLWDVDALLARP